MPVAASQTRLGIATEPHTALLVKVARYYHEQSMSQPAIAQKLNMSQSKVSRMLAEAVRTGIVRTTVVPPMETFNDLESELCDRYGIVDAVVVDANGVVDEHDLMRRIGSSAGPYLEATLTGNDCLGISSWSGTLLAMVEAMTQSRVRLAAEVIQLIGGAGHPDVQLQATRLVSQLAIRTRAELHLLGAPGLLPNKASRDALLSEPYVADVAARWKHLTTALVGIGSVQPSELLHDSGNAVTEAEMDGLRAAGAVGDVCQLFFNAEGELVESDFHDRVLGIDPDTLRSVRRRIGVAGGERKIEAIRGALQGSWINVLITDSRTAEQLV